MTCFAAVDLGGQSGRVVLGRLHDGRLTYREVHRFANLPREVEGRWYWDTDALFEATLDGLAVAAEAAAAQNDRLAGIGVDTWGVDYGLVTAAGELVGPVVHHRSASPEIMEQANALVPAETAWVRTGIEKAPMNTSGRLSADAGAGRLRENPTALLTPDLWTFRLTGTRKAERTIASTTELLDVRTGGWALDLAQRWGIDPAVLPPVVATATVAGQTLPEITERIGAAVTVYHVASHDTASAVAAATSASGTDGVVSCGSWALAGCLADRPALSDEARKSGFTNERSADGRYLVLRNLSGLWLLESCLSAWTPGDRTKARSDLLEKAEKLPEGPLVDVGDPVLRAPGDMPARIAGLAGRPLSPEQTVRCILDSLATAFATSLRSAAELTGVTMRRVHLLGGGSRVAALARSTVRATGLPVLAGPGEATSIGNLMVQAVASGVFRSLDEARAAVDFGGDEPLPMEP
jgi:rhamnulokinase